MMIVAVTVISCETPDATEKPLTGKSTVEDSQTEKPISNLPSHSETVTITTDANTNEPCFAASGYFNTLWNGIYFYVPYGKSADKTLMWCDLRQEDPEPIPLYSDFFGEDDPFTGFSPTGFRILPDEAATRENNGMPVYIIAYNRSVLIDGERTSHYRLVSFNTADNQLTVLNEDIGAGLEEIALYGDTLYYSKLIENSGSLIDDFLYDENSEKTENRKKFGVFAMPRTGGKAVRYNFPEDAPFFIRGVCDGKLCIESEQLQRVYRCDPDFSNAELIYSYTNETPVVAFIDGYLFYKEKNDRQPDFPEEVLSHLSSIRVFDLYKKPLDQFETSKAELVTRDVLRTEWFGGNTILFETLEELSLYHYSYRIDNEEHDEYMDAGAVFRFLNAPKNETGILFDFRSENQQFYTLLIADSDNYVLDYATALSFGHRANNTKQ